AAPDRPRGWARAGPDRRRGCFAAVRRRTAAWCVRGAGFRGSGTGRGGVGAVRVAELVRAGAKRLRRPRGGRTERAVSAHRGCWRNAVDGYAAVRRANCAVDAGRGASREALAPTRVPSAVIEHSAPVL